MLREAPSGSKVSPSRMYAKTYGREALLLAWRK
jgi:hypothetical protein